jgi:hypothetical protein
MSISENKIEPLKKVLERSLTIPYFQRPYKWSDLHVNQLIDDIQEQIALGKSCYRLGTIVLYNDKTTDQLQIVDGQQRLLTLTLLSGFLDKEKKHCTPYLLNHSFQSTVSVDNLKHNAAHIKRRVEALDKEHLSNLRSFFFNQCELVCVTLEGDDVSEAFQFFDSQNARGKNLEPYDLLKAYHLREMRQDDETEKTQCARRWESLVALDSKSALVTLDNDKSKLPSMHELINNVLYRIRRWAQGESALDFSGKDISVFKGVNLLEHRYRHVSPLQAVDCAVDQYNSHQLRRWDGQQMAYPFQSAQTLVNGRRFFEFIDNYARMYQTLFIQPHKDLEDIQETLNSYEGCYRIGDSYVKNLFYCTVLYYFDKFGDYELKRAARLCLIWSYRLRLEQPSIREESTDNYACNPRGLFKVISKAVHPQEVLSFPNPPVKVIATKVEGLKHYFEVITP